MSKQEKELSILDVGMSEDAAHGRKALPPEGMYDDCVVDNLEEVELSEKAAESGVRARVKVSVSCPTSDIPLDFYVNIKDVANPHPRSTQSKIMRACLGDKGQAAGKSLRDIIGCRFKMMIAHDSTPDGIKFADRKFLPA